jgi:hypothetical protein
LIRFFILLVISSTWPLSAQSIIGPFSPAAGQPGTTAISKDTNLIVAWATAGRIHRGYLDLADPSKGRVSQGDSSDLFGPADNKTVSLGDSGYVDLFFDPPLKDQPGWDIAIFENGFGDQFLELAFVEVSSNGQDFYRFGAISLTDTQVQVGSFGTLETSQLFQLAGKYRADFGTPFDFSRLSHHVDLDLDSIKVVRILDVVGSIDSRYGSRDSLGQLINDPYPSAFASGGFDLDAVALLAPQSLGQASTEPKEISVNNPFRDRLRWQKRLKEARLSRADGRTIARCKNCEKLVAGGWPKGIYILHLKIDGHWFQYKLLKV